MSVLYPVADNAQAALAAPKGRVARERDAERMAGEAVMFVSEFVGPTFKSEEAALDAHAGLLDDDRPGRRRMIGPEDRYCELKPIVDRGMNPFAGRRTAWRLSVSYWRTLSGMSDRPHMEQARKARKKAEAAELDPQALAVLAEQPLQPLHPQKALDIGLFEVRLPENPAIIVADE
ncbi:MAG TPA: hypothetical protein VMU59_02050 [Caulobacteraceae bacterium]|nr:hypothetical protein [Caulobacteraceae bacterium]